MLPQEIFLMFQPLRLFLVASEHLDREILSVLSPGSPLFQVKCWKDACGICLLPCVAQTFS